MPVDVKAGDVWMMDGQAYHAQAGADGKCVLLRPVLLPEQLDDDAILIYRKGQKQK